MKTSKQITLYSFSLTRFLQDKVKKPERWDLEKRTIGMCGKEGGQTNQLEVATPEYFLKPKHLKVVKWLWNSLSSVRFNHTTGDSINNKSFPSQLMLAWLTHHPLHQSCTVFTCFQSIWKQVSCSKYLCSLCLSYRTRYEVPPDPINFPNTSSLGKIFCHPS